MGWVGLNWVRSGYSFRGKMEGDAQWDGGELVWIQSPPPGFQVRGVVWWDGAELHWSWTLLQCEVAGQVWLSSVGRRGLDPIAAARLSGATWCWVGWVFRVGLEPGAALGARWDGLQAEQIQMLPFSL